MIPGRERERAGRRRPDSEEPAPEPLPSLGPAGVLGLQRAAGNQAVVRALAPQAMIQRKNVSPDAFLNGLAAANAGDAEWDPQWTLALTAATANFTFATWRATIDDASEHDAHALIGALKALSEANKPKPNFYKLAIDAVRWHAGIESDTGGSGFGSLDTSSKSFTGRPAFPKFTQENLPLKAGQHRRHILPWHAIREFVSLAYAAHHDIVLKTIWEAMTNPPDPAAGMAFDEATGHVMSGREKSGKVNVAQSEDEVLKAGLFVMNGNPRNLWPGKGSTNSAINTAQMHMNDELKKLKTFQDVAKLAETWQNAKGKDVYKTATTVGSHLLSQEGAIAASLLADPTKEQEAVEGVARKVSEVVTSNLEIDVLGDFKEQTEIAQSKAKALEDPVRFIDNVVTGRVPIDKVEPEFVRAAIVEFLTYVK